MVAERVSAPGDRCTRKVHPRSPLRPRVGRLGLHFSLWHRDVVMNSLPSPGTHGVARPVSDLIPPRALRKRNLRLGALLRVWPLQESDAGRCNG